MSFILTIEVRTIENLMHHVAEHSGAWDRQGNVRPWFRGQADAALPPLPSVFRADYDEFQMTTAFRLKALAYGQTPETDRLDQWLFLGQHFGLPTRLLDWTESVLFALFFAIAQWASSDQPEECYRSSNMGIWMLHPLELNGLSGAKGFPNTWTQGNVAHEHCRMAFHPKDERPPLRTSRFPVAVQASAVDRRVVVQRSCFTIHGTDERDFESILLETELVSGGYFLKFIIPRTFAPKLLADLTDLGISFSTVYPDFAGLAQELRHRFGPKPALRIIGDYIR
jgi:hypothetical protein